MDIEKGNQLRVGSHKVNHQVNSLLAESWKKAATNIDTENCRLKEAIINAKI